MVCACLGKTEDDTPIGANGDRVKTLPFAFEGVKPETGQIHVRHRAGSIEPGQNISQLAGMFRIHTAGIVVLVNALQSFVAYRAEPTVT